MCALFQLIPSLGLQKLNNPPNITCPVHGDQYFNYISSFNHYILTPIQLRAYLLCSMLFQVMGKHSEYRYMKTKFLSLWGLPYNGDKIILYLYWTLIS